MSDRLRRHREKRTGASGEPAGSPVLSGRTVDVVAAGEDAS